MRYFLYVLALLIAPVIAFAFDCPHCKSHDGLVGRDPALIVCSQCTRQVCPGDVFKCRKRVSFASDDLLVTGLSSLVQERTHLELLLPDDLALFNPEMIITRAYLDQIMAYLNQHYQGVSQSSQVILSAVSLAQSLMLSVPALSNLEFSDYQIALWWLVGYWVLHLSPRTQEQAQSFLNQAPQSLHLHQAQNQINSLQTQAANMQELPGVISLFAEGNGYNFSAAETELNKMRDGTPYLYQVNYPGGILVVFHIQGTFYVITPYNYFFTVTSMESLLTILSQMGRAHLLSGRVIVAAWQTALLTGIGGAFGALTGIPIVLFGMIGGSDSGAIARAYGAWMAASAAAFNFVYNPLGSSPTIYGSPDEKKNKLSGKEQKKQ